MLAPLERLGPLVKLDSTRLELGLRIIYFNVTYLLRHVILLRYTLYTFYTGKQKEGNRAEF